MSKFKNPFINTVIASGRLIRDAEARSLGSGTSYAKGCIVIERPYKKNDKWEKESTFVEFTVWGPQSERVGRMVKGDDILLEGALKLDEWEDKATGQKRSKMTINAYRVQPLTWPDKESDAQPAPQPAQTQAAPMPEDDIPF